MIELGAEAYGVIAPVELVVNAALYPDIAHMRVADSKVTEQPPADPIYFPTNCPLHRKYALLKERLNQDQQDQQDQQEQQDHKVIIWMVMMMMMMMMMFFYSD